MKSSIFSCFTVLVLLSGCSSPGGTFRVRSPFAGDGVQPGGLFGPGRNRVPDTPRYDRRPDAAPDRAYFGRDLDNQLPDASRRAHPPVSWNSPPKSEPAPPLPPAP